MPQEGQRFDSAGEIRWVGLIPIRREDGGPSAVCISGVAGLSPFKLSRGIAVWSSMLVSYASGAGSNPAPATKLKVVS